MDTPVDKLRALADEMDDPAVATDVGMVQTRIRDIASEIEAAQTP